jgi:hypothetical protein
MKTYKNATQLCAEYGGTLHSFGRSIYKGVDCGPWTRLVVTENRYCHYEDEGANLPENLIDRDIRGVEFGSIVEGSDVEIGPVFLKFPFTSEKMWKVLAEIDDEAKFYWHRDND